MKFIRSATDLLVFSLGKREREWLLAVLALYPRLSAAPEKLSRSTGSPGPESGQRLLDEALAEQRAENRRQMRALLADPRHFQETETGARLSLAPADLEWLLQILNDIRVGSWVRLGSPEAGPGVLNKQTAPDIWAMEMAGYFQSHLLEAMTGEA